MDGTWWNWYFIHVHTTSGASRSGPPSTYLNVVIVDEEVAVFNDAYLPIFWNVSENHILPILKLLSSQCYISQRSKSSLVYWVCHGLCLCGFGFFDRAYSYCLKFKTTWVTQHSCPEIRGSATHLHTGECHRSAPELPEETHGPQGLESNCCMMCKTCTFCVWCSVENLDISWSWHVHLLLKARRQQGKCRCIPAELSQQFSF